MKKTFISIIAAAAALCSCQSLIEEFQPVFTGKYQNPEPAKVWTKESIKKEFKVPEDNFLTIKQLCQMYEQGKPWTMDKNLFITGIVSTTDQPGNFYKTFYIQDETSGIEIKVGKNGLYNDYLPGQRVFIRCKDLTLGVYGFKTGNYGGAGTIQIGGSRNLYENGSPSDEYETSYLEIPYLINEHILCGEVEGEVTPIVATSANLPAKEQDQRTSNLVGKLVTIKGLKYANETFVLLYLDSNKDKKSYTNRVFLSDSNGVNGSDKTHGITTWAMSKNKMTELLKAGTWDSCAIGSGSDFVLKEDGSQKTVGDLRGANGNYDEMEKVAASVSQYFNLGDIKLCIRTSGFCKFADCEIPADVLSGKKTLDVTGVLTMYQGTMQIVVNDISDFVVDGKPLAR